MTRLWGGDVILESTHSCSYKLFDAAIIEEEFRAVTQLKKGKSQKCSLCPPFFHLSDITKVLSIAAQHIPLKQYRKLEAKEAAN